jgi:hypothetical protein
MNNKNLTTKDTIPRTRDHTKNTKVIESKGSLWLKKTKFDKNYYH